MPGRRRPDVEPGDRLPPRLRPVLRGRTAGTVLKNGVSLLEGIGHLLAFAQVHGEHIFEAADAPCIQFDYAQNRFERLAHVARGDEPHAGRDGRNRRCRRTLCHGAEIYASPR